jgi:hypothetical protein
LRAGDDAGCLIARLTEKHGALAPLEHALSRLPALPNAMDPKNFHQMVDFGQFGDLTPECNEHIIGAKQYNRR